MTRHGARDRQAQRDAHYARTTISLPPSLKQRMKTAGSGVNWSAIAAEAFEAKLISLKEYAMAELPDKDEALKRLRALKDRPEASDHSATAFALGKRWAMADAHPNELERLDAFCEAHQLDRPIEQWTVEVTDRSMKRLFEELTCAILGVSGGGAAPARKREARLSDQARDLWQRRIGLEKRPDARAISGFVHGALEFWREVKDHL